jgi:hypothetical protein
MGMALALLVAATGTPGCTSPSAPPKPPGGGQRLVLDFPTYRDSVAPVISAHGCDAGGDCHGGGIRGTLQLSPAGAKDVHYDFDQVVLQVYPTQRDSSEILLRPLADSAGGHPHPYKAFASTADPEFRTIRAWVQAGVLQ